MASSEKEMGAVGRVPPGTARWRIMGTPIRRGANATVMPSAGLAKPARQSGSARLSGAQKRATGGGGGRYCAVFAQARSSGRKDRRWTDEIGRNWRGKGAAAFVRPVQRP